MAIWRREWEDPGRLHLHCQVDDYLLQESQSLYSLEVDRLRTAAEFSPHGSHINILEWAEWIGTVVFLPCKVLESVK